MDESLAKENKANQIQLWSEKVEKCKASGLSQAKWCKLNGVPQSTYSHWKQRFYQFEGLTQESKFVEVPVVSSSPIKISCGEIKIEISDSADLALIRNVIAALKSC